MKEPLLSAPALSYSENYSPNLAASSPVSLLYQFKELVLLEGSTDIVLISDSSLGAVWRMNVTSGAYSIAMRHVLFTTCTNTFPVGINGISTYEERLYFVNSAQ